ncbi:hypothetical protein PVK06_005246 [Gossypium arboreum]|uniref:RNase H type-1 domain-containing protein n=1 Tax=Gossypium arboreum TaxID=29729 RepID=A0ABR0QU71_GOSAR|nr:hypothetical protein PVK06_005246 [Gossypium arboreum]
MASIWGKCLTDFISVRHFPFSLHPGIDISRLISLVSRSKASLALKGHKDTRQFMTRPVPYYKYLCLICNSYPTESDCFSLQCTEPENGVQEVKPGQATKCSQSPVTSVSSEDEIGAVLEPAHLDSNTTGSNLKFLGWNKLNTRYSSVGDLDKDGAKSSIRSHEGHWVRGSVRHMELWALKDALNFAISLDIVNMEIQHNATNVICLTENIENKSLSNHLFSSIFREFQQTIMKRAFNETSVLMRWLWYGE